MKTHKFARKPFYVDAVRVSEANIAEVAEWAEGSVEKTEDGQAHVKVKVHRPLTERQTQAFIGDWVLFAGTGFKVYTPKAFDKSFEKVKTLTKAQADEAGIKVPHEPRAKIGTVGLAFKEAEAKKGPVPTAPKKIAPFFNPSKEDSMVRVIENAEIQSVSVVSDPLPETAGFNIDRVQEAIADSEGVEVEIAPGVTGVFEDKPAVELSEEEKQANADAAIAEVLSDDV